MTGSLVEHLPTDPGPVDPDAVIDAFTSWAAARDLSLYPHQEEAILELLSGSNVILATPTGSGKSLVALAAHAAAVAGAGRSWYTAPVKALVSEKFFDLCRELGPENVGLMTGDTSVNADAPVICCTTEVLANLALRDGRDADAAFVVLDEFHFYADPDRGWAWQVPLLELPQACFLLLSATLGDVSFLRADLTARTGRPTVLVADAVRPVPLRFEYRRTLLHHTVEDLLAADAAPLYLVNFTQRDAVAVATAMASLTRLDDDAKRIVSEELALAKLGPGFGKDLARLLRSGVGVHHAGMLPRHRRLVERLAQRGVLRVISGTDTLGVGVNLPIRTVVLTRLYKFDGADTRLLSAREFHQVAGRAGRAGFDTEGLVVALAPAHVAENEAADARAGEDPKRKRKLRKAAAPKGFVSYDEQTFLRLQTAAPEPLTSSFRMTPGMLLQLLDRPGDAWHHGRALLLGSHEPRQRQRRHVRHTVNLFKALRDAGVVRRTAEPDRWGRFVEVDHSLQDDFALDQLLSPFLLHALPRLDRDDEQYPLAVLAFAEAIVDNPTPILMAQRDKARDEAMAAMKAAGVEYDQRIAELDKVTFPQPMRDDIYATFDDWRGANRWIGSRNIAPKGVVRDLWDRSMDFPAFVRHYGIKRSEGLLLRYLSEVYKVLVRSVPDEVRTDGLDELADWLGAIIRATDSSLLDEWAGLFAEGSDQVVDVLADPAGPEPVAPDPTADRRALRALVRTRAFFWVQCAATGAWEEMAEDLADADDRAWTADRLQTAFAPYFDEHATIGIDADARGPAHFRVEEAPGRWTVQQTLVDPDGFHEWYLPITVDLVATHDSGALVAALGDPARR